VQLCCENINLLVSVPRIQHSWASLAVKETTVKRQNRNCLKTKRVQFLELGMSSARTAHSTE